MPTLLTVRQGVRLEFGLAEPGTPKFWSRTESRIGNFDAPPRILAVIGARSLGFRRAGASASSYSPSRTTSGDNGARMGWFGGSRPRLQLVSHRSLRGVGLLQAVVV